ncbi:NAD(P)-dependent oxidoreductase [Actinoplanes missouriensis]|uniref:NAD(P)-dependent oxidoreductase n=1 Tax=Actinoplanes missouriensis TaxID=1866 RepID=UPI0033DBC1DB
MDSSSPRVTLSGAVMAHPQRLAEAQIIADADPRGRIRVVTDPDPSGSPTALRTAPLTWSCVAPDATHHLVLQDDVDLAEGFFEHAERAAAAAPGEAISFYAGWEARNGAVARLAALVGVEWAYTLQEHTPCQALMLPADVARGYAAFQAEHGDNWPYDVVVQRYLNALGIPVRFCTPATVQHTELPSLAGNSYHGYRQATLYTGRAGTSASSEAVQFPVVPFYQYGEARCAVRDGADWDYVETDRYLRRRGLLEPCLAGYASAVTALPGRTSRAVWLTAFAIGVVTAAEPEPDPAVAAAVMETLGTGGLCQEHPADELIAMSHPVRDLALEALRQGRAAGRADDAPPVARPRVAVTGAGRDFARQLAGLLGDLGFEAVHVPDPTDVRRLEDVPLVVHVGSPADDDELLADVLTAAQKTAAARLVYLSSTAVYRGLGDGTATESSITEAPADPVARQWWLDEERCRAWGAAAGIAVQVLRLGAPLGPHAPAGTAPVRIVHLSWTRRPVPLNDDGVHHVLDFRDMADAIGAVLSAPAARPVLNVASATYGERELAGLLTAASRKTPWETSDEPAERWALATGLIETEVRWRPTATISEGIRALAQWYACDIHGTNDHRI